MFVIAIDALSFDVRASRAVAIAAQQFIDRLPQDDKVGIFTFPLGPKLVPTTDRPATSRALAAVLGQRGLTSSAYTIRFSELVDMALERVGNAPGEVTNEVISRECEGNNVFATPAPRRTGLLVSDSSCATAVIQEAAARVQAYEAQAMASLGMLRNLFVSLALVPGRKVVVLASAGMPISDRLGGRPDVGNLPTQVGIEAARANAVLNTMFIDSTFIEMFSAEASSGLAASKDLTRDTSVANRGLEQLSGKTGGLFMKILNSNPETAFNRILREMSAYYLLGVEPDPADRDGHPREIKVSVNQRGATVRARNFVIIPKARPD
jgi:VWFA-related protein